jgi:hemerythrin
VPVEWTDDLATGVEKIDQQHQELYQQVGRLHEAMRAGRLEEVPAIVEYLQRYALDHFATEEREMVASAYPGLPQHRRLHQRFVDDFLRHKALLAVEITPRAVVDLSQWLGEWLREHVRTVDADLARHLRR